jgi:glucose/arabinose dehydrogenase
VFTLGHRNPQGLDWQPGTGALFASEHGPSGFDGPGGGDEINLVLAGRNYGWPTVHHQERQPGLEAALLEFTPAIAPAGMTFYSGKAVSGLAGDLFVATLRGEHLLRITFDRADSRKPSRTERLFEREFGRIRDVAEGPDGWIYLCTSNRDGRGKVRDGDDKIVRVRSR